MPPSIRLPSVGLLALFLSVTAANAQGQPPSPAHPAPIAIHPFGAVREVSDAAISHLNRADFSRAADSADPILLERFPLPGGQAIDLELERFSVTSPDTRFVIGRENAADEPLLFDPSTILLYRGRAAGYPGSRIFLSVAPGGVTGRIDLGPGNQRYHLSSRGGATVAMDDGEVVVFPARSGGGLGLPVPFCGVGPVSPTPNLSPGPQPAPPPTPPLAPRGLGPVHGLRHLQLAVDTDNEFFTLFPDADAAATYIVQLYAVVSDIYIRDVNTRIELTFVRLWDRPNDPYNTGSLLARIQAVFASAPNIPRDAIQLLSGRRNLNPAGEAYLSALCTTNCVSWCAYIHGSFADPDTPAWTNRDIMLTAHELGHNAGTGHTHDYALDSCGNGALPARRGSIMSYCGQAYSGGDANHDLWFHEHTANLMRQHIFTRPCMATDCNANNIPDTNDIAAGTSLDANANGVPDECEDCNGNGSLDPLDIASGVSPDVNANGVPDECEADCNADGVPDTHEIALAPGLDLNANRVLDSCEADCDGDGASDYNQIQQDMSLDIDRDAVLDTCQRCTPGGPTNIAALDHAWNLYAGSRMGSGVREFYAATGVATQTFGIASLPDTQDLIITPDRRVLVSSDSIDAVLHFTANGALASVLIPAGSGGLASPACMLLTPAGTLLVVSRDTSAILEFDAQTGAFLRTFIQPGAGGLVSPHGIARTPGGNIVVTSSDNRVLEYDGQTGDFIRVLVDITIGSELNDPRGLLFKPDGNLLVCSRGSDAILQYDGQTGAFINRWNYNGVPGTLYMDEPWCLRLGPDGDVYASRSHAHRSGGGPQALHLSDVRIFQFDVTNGWLVRAYVMGDDTGLSAPTGFDFMPGDAADCNRNHLPDTCDIAAGTSNDHNGNGRPDECDCLADWNSNNAVNSGDISAFLTAWLAAVNAGTLGGDVNNDGATNSGDISSFLTAWLDAVTAGC